MIIPIHASPKDLRLADLPQGGEFQIVTQSPKMRKLTDMSVRVAFSSAPVLLTGESGTGKELFARRIHDNSSRAGGAFVKVNCAALAENLVESELFGHVRGSFTDAVQARTGRFELAAGGTLLLDEISEISLRIQAKLLRVLEEKEFEKVGCCTPVKADVRIVATSNRNLRAEVEKGTFRLDLLHRLNVVEMRIPALRERREDISVLAMHFLRSFQYENKIELSGFTKEALQALSKRKWSGNVRELRNVIHRACILADNPRIDSDLVMPEPDQVVPERRLPDEWLQTKLADIEKQIILAALARYGNKRIVAENLGVSTRTLSNKMKTYQDSSQPEQRAA